MSFLKGLLGDVEQNFAKALEPAALKFIQPLLTEFRTQVLSSVSGTAPVFFASEVRKLYDFDDAEIDAIWTAAIGAAADILGQSAVPTLSTTPTSSTVTQSVQQVPAAADIITADKAAVSNAIENIENNGSSAS